MRLNWVGKQNLIFFSGSGSTECEHTKRCTKNLSTSFNYCEFDKTTGTYFWLLIVNLCNQFTPFFLLTVFGSCEGLVGLNFIFLKSLASSEKIANNKNNENICIESRVFRDYLEPQSHKKCTLVTKLFIFFFFWFTESF